MTKRACVLSPLAALTALVLSAGCSPTDVILPAFYELRGAKGTLLWIQEPAVGTLTAYRSVYFEPLTSSLGNRLCPPRLAQDFDQTAREYAASLGNYASGGPPLKVTSDVSYFQNKGLLSAALLLVRVKFTADGHQVGDALLRVESKSFREGSTGDLAEAAVKTIAKYIGDERSPRR